ncbi:MAG: hypothetical protein IPJ85_18095 [Flavobacteriales bacterium]|nr:hypothetical protein [Flavobacteriales bacterium]
MTKVDFSGPVHKVWVDERRKSTPIPLIVGTHRCQRHVGGASQRSAYATSVASVTACAVCDGFFYRGEHVVLVGAGVSACEEATYPAKLGAPRWPMLVRKG